MSTCTIDILVYLKIILLRGQRSFCTYWFNSWMFLMDLRQNRILIIISLMVSIHLSIESLYSWLYKVIFNFSILETVHIVNLILNELLIQVLDNLLKERISVSSLLLINPLNKLLEFFWGISAQTLSLWLLVPLPYQKWPKNIELI